MPRSLAALVSVASLAFAASPALAADSGFRPAKDGFSFANYGNDNGQPNLTAVEMRRLFGDAVCGSKVTDGSCALTPPAQQWMNAQNAGMNGGHCMGFSVVALQIFAGASAAATFGVPTTFAIPLGPAISREIAYGFVYQGLDSVRNAMTEGTPKQVLAKLDAALASKAETYTLGIYKPGFKDGHAITPYAVEDRGGGKSAIKVYDNNFPNEEREVIVDTKADTFTYNTATNPKEEVDLYQGDAKTKTLDLSPTTPGQGVQPCPFCAGAAAPAQEVQVVSTGGLVNHAGVTVSDGRHVVGTGPRGGVINTFGDKADVLHVLEASKGGARREPVYFVAPHRAYTITLRNRHRFTLPSDGVRLTGPGWEATVAGLRMAPGQRVTLKVSANGSRLVVTSNRTLAPFFVTVGRTEAGPDHGFVLQRDSRLALGKPLGVTLRPGAHRLSLAGPGGTYDMAARIVDEEGDRVLVHRDLNTETVDDGDDEVTFDYEDWNGQEGETIVMEGDDGQEAIDSEEPLETEAEDAFEEVSGETIEDEEDEDR